ncbi:MAG: hypothetical protein U0269_03210 [Polyangiales bacterium]
MSDSTIWLQLSPLDGVEQGAIERLAAFEGARLVKKLGKDMSASLVLAEPHKDAKLDKAELIVTGAEFRRYYGVGLSDDERVAAMRRWAESCAPSYYKLPATHALIAGAVSESSREIVVRAAIEALSDIALEDLYVSDPAVDEAMRGRPAAAALGCSWTLRANVEADLARARWLGEDPARLPNIHRVHLFADSLDEARSALQMLGEREISLLKLPRLSSKDLKALVAELPPTVKGVDAFYCKAGSTLFGAVVRSKLWPALRQLNLHNNDGRSAGLKSLVGSKKKTALETLDIGYNHLRSADFEALAKAPWLSQLRSLSMKYNDALAQGAQSLFETGDFSKLESLDFGANEIGDGGVAAIVANPTVRSLSSLTIEGNNSAPLIQSQGAHAIAHWQGAHALRTLNLGQNAIGDDGFVAIVTSPNLANVKTLDLQYNSITATGIERLSGVATPMRPKRVMLSGNAIGAGQFGDQPREPAPTQQKSLWDDAHWLSDCEQLVLYNTSLDPDTLAALLQSNSLPKLRSLDLSSNYGLSNEMLKFLVQSPLAQQLESLEILYWDWRSGAAKRLLDAPFADRLLRLSLSAKGLAAHEVTALRVRFAHRLYLA